MNITIVRDSFIEILQKAGYFISNRISDLKVFKGVLIKAEQTGIVVKTTNINEYFSGEIGGKVNKTGEVLVDFKTLFELVKNLPDAKIVLEKKDKQLIINSRSGEIKLLIMDDENFPENPKNKENYLLPNNLFKEKQINQVIFSAASDEARPILTGVCFDFQEKNTRVVGTDGFRMSMYKNPTIVEQLNNQKLVVSAKSLASILKIFKNNLKEVSYSLKDRKMIFQGNNLVVTTKLLEGEFPPYEKVIPQSTETTILLKKDELLEIIKSSSLFAKEGSNMLSLDIKETGLIISSTGSSIGEATFNINLLDFQGKENRVVFNYRYLLEFLNNVTNEEIIFEMSNPFAPGLFKSKKDSGLVHIIMPIRSQD